MPMEVFFTYSEEEELPFLLNVQARSDLLAPQSYVRVTGECPELPPFTLYLMLKNGQKEKGPKQQLPPPDPRPKYAPATPNKADFRGEPQLKSDVRSKACTHVSTKAYSFDSVSTSLHNKFSIIFSPLL